MKPLVIDTSVAAKWFFPEPHSERSLRLLSGRNALLAPDLIVAEFGNVVWKRCRRGELTADQAAAIVQDFLRMPLEITPAGPLVGTALDLAITSGRTVYDCLYLALAIDRDCRLVTGDERFVNALSRTTLARRIRWIGR